MKKQPMIPGLDKFLSEPPPDNRLEKLSERILKLEVEVSLLRILVEKGERAST